MSTEDYMGYGLSSYMHNDFEYWCVFSPAPLRVCLGVFSSPESAKDFIEWLNRLDEIEQHDIAQQEKMGKWLAEQHFFDEVSEAMILAAFKETERWREDYPQGKMTAPSM